MHVVNVWKCEGDWESVDARVGCDSCRAVMLCVLRTLVYVFIVFFAAAMRVLLLPCGELVSP